MADSEHWVTHWPLTTADGRPDYRRWGRLWELAIMVSVLKAWRRYADDRGGRTSDIPAIDALVPEGFEENPFDLVAGYLSNVENNLARGKAVFPDLSAIRQYMISMVSTFPSTYMFLDNQDDFFFANPDYWRTI